jgi:hypothetical protein
MKQLLIFAAVCISAAVSAKSEATIISPGKTIARHHTLEIGVRHQQLDSLVDAWFEYGNGNGVNPYTLDGGKNEVHALFTHVRTGKTVTAQGFYYQAALADERANLYRSNITEWPWRIRFAVPDTGVWECLVQVEVALTGKMAHDVVLQNRFLFPVIRFNCVPSERHGMLRVNSGQRYLEHEDGTPFFAIGQNIAWADKPILRGYAPFYPVYITGFYDMLNYVNSLGDQGGNYVRIIRAPWSTGIEWEKAGEYSQERAWVMDSILKIAERKNMYIHLCLEMHSGYITDYDREYSWYAHPYRALAGKDSTVTEALTQQATIELFKQRYRYIHRRWGYSPHISVYELMSELTFWQGYTKHKNEFITFHEQVANYFKRDLNDAHIFSTCFGPPPYGKLFGIPEIGVTSMHHYGNNRTSNRDGYKIINGIHPYTIEKRGFHRRWNKPFIFGEAGMINGPVNAADPDDYEYCTDVNFHNNIWASGFSGSYGTAVYWFQWKNNGYREKNYPALRRFFDETKNITAYIKPHTTEKGLLESFYKTNEAGTAVIGWLHNTTYWWGNMTPDCSDRAKKKMALPHDDDKSITTPKDIGDATLTISGLAKKQNVTITWFSTRGKGELLKTETARTDGRGRLTLTPPDKGADWAYRVETGG